MPYIKEIDRFEIRVPGHLRKDPGALNYAITMLVQDFIEANGLRYSTVNAAVGVLECAKLELYRRVAVPHENMKRARDGDVYALHLTG